MTGLPAARQTDMTLKGGPITQGSRTVYIGTSGGVACSTCPGGVSEGNPVNPMLGAKVQSGELDLTLPGPLSFIVSRDYSSYQTDTPAPVGLLGPGWWLPTEVSLLQTGNLLTVNDSKGRSIRFEPLAPGESAYSRSENLWIVRGGLERLNLQKELSISRLNLAWIGLHKGDRCNPALFFVTNNLLGPWWVFGMPSLADEVTGKRLHLIGLNDRFGQTQRIKRNTEGHAVAVQDGVGRQYRLELKSIEGLANAGAAGWGADSGVRLVAVHLTHDPHESDLPKLPLVRYEYSPRGELVAVYSRDSCQVRAFQYHPQLLGRMTAHAYAGRPPVRYVYNEAGKVVQQIRQGDLSYRFDYAEDSTTVTDSLERVRIYHFKGKEGLRRVVKLQEADGSITQSRFDDSGRLLASIDALGRETRYELDVATGVMISTTQPDGLQSRFSYNAQGQIEQRTRPNGASDSYSYDRIGRLASFTDALGYVTRYHYEDERTEQPQTIEDAKGGIKQLAWNSTRQLTSYTDCSGSVTRYRYDRWGQIIETTGEEGARSKTDHDERGRVIATTNALNQVTSYAYNDAGDLILVTAPDGNSMHFERDPQGRPKVYHYGGYTQQFDYDEAGRMVRLTNENGAHTTFEYDLMDRLTRQVNFDGRTQQYQFNAAGALLQSNDEGLISHYHYDKSGRLLRRQMGHSEQGPAEYYSYTEDGQLAKVRHTTELGGNSIAAEFQRDLLGRITRETQRITGSDSSTVWLHSVDRQFNETGVESRTTYAGLPPIEWQTYGSGHLHGMVLDGRSVIDFERDKLHRETNRQFGSTQTTRTYDAVSRLSHLRTHSPLVGEDQALNRLHHYDATGQLTRIDTPSGLHEYGYDKARRLIAASQPSLALHHYRFDPAGNRLFENQVTTTANDNWEETVRQHMQDKSFNLLGNNEAKYIHETELKWMDNRIKDDGEYHYEYDAWGNLQRKYKAEGNEEHRYHYDSNHRLIRYTLESDEEVRGANYHYDPFGRRVAKQVQEADKDGNLAGAPTTTFFGWDGDRLVLTEKDKSQIHTIYEPGSFTPMIRIEGKKVQPKRLVQKLQEHQGIRLDKEAEAKLDGLEKELRQGNLSKTSQQWMQQAQLQPETLKAMLDEKPPGREQQIHLYQCDHLGTPLALIDQQGKIAWAARVGPWGGVIAEYNPENLEQPIRLPGQHEDSESGLYYNRHRYYDSVRGSYINQDPIGLSGGDNFYLYPGDPLLEFDAMGLQKVSTGRSRTGMRQPAVFDSKMPQKDLDKETADFIALPEVYNPGNLANGKKPWQEFSPYDYTQYCEKWSKANLTCKPKDREPGRDVKYPSDYIPNNGAWKTATIPAGYSCDTPVYFPEMNSAGSAPSADMADYADMAAKILRNRGRARK